MKLHNYKAVIKKVTGCLFVFVVMGIFNDSVAQSQQIQSNEKQVVECTPVQTKRDIAYERQQKGERQIAETTNQTNIKEVIPASDNDQIEYGIKEEELKAPQKTGRTMKMTKKTDSVNDDK